MLVDFDYFHNGAVVGALSSMKCSRPRGINYDLCSDEENTVNFNKLIGHFGGEITNESVKGFFFKIELDQLNIGLNENIPIEELKKTDH